MIGSGSRLAALTALYVLGGKLGLQFAFVHVSATPVWPPTGIALAAVLLLGARAWPAVFAGAFLVNVTTVGTALTSLGIAAGNTLEALVGAALVRRPGGPAVLDHPRGVFAFALAALVSGTVAASVGPTALALGGFASWDAYPWIWLTWWLGDATGALVFAPAILAWARDRSPAPLARRGPEALALAGTAAAGALLVFGGISPAGLRNLPVAFLCLPPLLWAAFRFGQREAAALILGLAAAAVVGTRRGYGPFALDHPNVSLLLLQAFMATASVTALVVAALVAERQRAADAARASEERLRLAMEAGGMGTWEWEVASGAVRWSERLEAIHGLAPGTFGGTYRAFLADIHPADRTAVEAAVARALDTGHHRVEYRIVRPDGAVRWVEGRGETLRDAAGRPVRLIGVCADVTERRRAQDRLTFLGEIARSISASLDLDTVLRRITEGAQALCASDTASIFLREDGAETMAARYRVGPALEPYRGIRVRAGEGLGGEAILARRPVRTDDYLADPRAPEHLRRLARQAGTVTMMAVPILVGDRAAGLLYLSNRTPRPFTDEDETICARLAEQAAVAIQNARLFGLQHTARAEAEAANRAKDEFLAMLGHELRNPLGALSSAARVLALVEPGDPRATGARHVIDRQVRHLARLVDDLLDVARVMSGKVVLRPEPVDLAAAVTRTVEALAASGRLARHQLQVEGRPAWVLADPTRLEQVITNLLENAVKYTPDGGRVTVSVGAEGDRAVLRVQDSGIGIAPDLLPRIFDLFVQGDRSLDRRGGGLGIGLTLVRRLVELHDGTVGAASEGPGRGATFTVRLPAARAGGPAAPAAPAPAPRRASILVVEDSADARQMLGEVLRLGGHEVHEVADGAAAVELALTVKPDLVLLDVGLPGMDGYEVVRRLRADPRGRSLRVVAVTGYGQADDRQQALAAGFDAHLVKPVDMAAIERLLG